MQKSQFHCIYWKWNLELGKINPWEFVGFPSCSSYDLLFLFILSRLWAKPNLPLVQSTAPFGCSLFSCGKGAWGNCWIWKMLRVCLVWGRWGECSQCRGTAMKGGCWTLIITLSLSAEAAGWNLQGFNEFQGAVSFLGCSWDAARDGAGPTGGCAAALARALQHIQHIPHPWGVQPHIHAAKGFRLPQILMYLLCGKAQS